MAEQLSRLAGLEWAVTVQPLDDGDGLGWRRRVRFAVGPAGELGLRAHRSHPVVPLSHCPIGAPGVGDAGALQRTGRGWPSSRWPSMTGARWSSWPTGRARRGTGRGGDRRGRPR